ncbi:MAG TPA: 2,4-dihydroxyhept-2-ene-1,7-dioic acid aldolase [Candidatus Hydrogenedentes bacterium]|nr:2,4-dihydroxyhept-2-ene-1,7-dioic acid aldolase [Candidatus Hydrogenedentota bacterium]HIJ73390.1 2,4-dihydroxyhept-2-ene-1,7-dioic acid aldolase [Candidatus Hydrogenedentota bacterium]
MTNNTVRKALLERKVTLGGWIQCGNAATAEIFAHAGFDWVAADAEHSDFDVASCTQLFRGLHGRGCTPLVRVRENDTLAIRQMLDAGAAGVIIPLIASPQEAQRAVAASKYPPQGVRGYGFARMNEWGANFDLYAASANENVAIVVMIESKQGVENIDAILAVDGVDGVFIGPYDLSGSYGIPGQTDAPAVVEACKHVVAACASTGKSAGLHVVKPTPENVTKAIADGFTFIALGLDSVFLQQGARSALAAARAAIEDAT